MLLEKQISTTNWLWDNLAHQQSQSIKPFDNGWMTMTQRWLEAKSSEASDSSAVCPKIPEHKLIVLGKGESRCWRTWGRAVWVTHIQHAVSSVFYTWVGFMHKVMCINLNSKACRCSPLDYSSGFQTVDHWASAWGCWMSKTELNKYDLNRDRENKSCFFFSLHPDLNKEIDFALFLYLGLW